MTFWSRVKPVLALFVAAAVLAACAPVNADEPATAPNPKPREGLKAEGLRLSPADMKWWSDAKFGMFIHWGVYAVPATGEWSMMWGKIPVDKYDKFADEFNPKHYDPAAWVKAARNAGMRYMVLTARHHDGYAMWDSPSSYGDFCSTKRAAKRDFVADYMKACHKAGMRVGLYYSPMDWRFPGYFDPKGLPENAALMKKQCWGQVEELVRKYGKIDVFWWDGAWLAHKGTNEDAAWLWETVKLNQLIRKYHPKAVINPRSGWEGDFDTEEGNDDIVVGPIRDFPWEKCLNLNNITWGYNTMQRVMSRDETITWLIDVVDRGGNMLLNVGPDRDGVIPPAHVERLREVGLWLNKFGKSIYGTRPGPFQPVDHVYGSTHSAKRVYVHVLNWKGKETIILPPLDVKVKSCSIMTGGPVAFTQTDKQIEVTVPQARRQTPATVLVLTTDRPVETKWDQPKPKK